MTEQPRPPKDYATPQERLADQDWASVAKAGIGGMVPASSGWILAVTIMFLGMTAINYLSAARSSETLKKYLDSSLTSAGKIEEHRSEEMRRCQESYKALANEAMRQRGEVADQVIEHELAKP